MKTLGLLLACLLFALPAAAQQVNVALVPVVSASAAKGLALKASPGRLYSVYATNASATAGLLILLNATTVPGDGTVAPLLCVPIPASGNVSVNFSPTPPAQFSTGIVAAVTSSGSCFTLTTGTITAFFGGMLQ